MKNLRGIVLVFLFFSLKTLAAEGPESAESIFQKGNAAYRAGEYAEAALLYESLVSKNWKNAAVFYNLGNASFKQKHPGRAILNYERARRFSPRDRDVLANLAFVSGLLEYRVEDKRNWYLRMGEAALTTFTREEIGILTLAFSLLFLAGWAIPLYLRPATLWGWKRKTLLVLTLTCLGLWLSKGFHEGIVKEGVTLKSQATVRYGPSHKDQVALRLGEGIKVRVKKTSGEWSRVVLTNGETGWMHQEELGIV
jgi:tetratricopeptide (TPR) repeat protein